MLPQIQNQKKVVKIKSLQHKYTSPYCHHILSIHHQKETIPQYSGNLFLSGVQGLRKNVINEYGISSVLTLMDEWTYNYNDMDKKIHELNLIGDHKWIDLHDDLESSIHVHIEDALNFVEQKLKSKNVLIHCYMGISRSASIVLAFLMKNHNMTLDQAYIHTVGIRDTIEPNDRFWDELKKYENELKQRKELKQEK